MGASSGNIHIAACELNKSDELPIQRTILQTDGLVGPLALNVQVTNQDGMSINRSSARMSTPLPAATGGKSPYGPGSADWFPADLGSYALELETQTGGAYKRWYADLRSGTYALPYCDQVRVGVRIQSVPGVWVDPGPGMSIAACVVQGVPAQAALHPWLYTLWGTLFVAGDPEPSPVVGEWWPRFPDGAFRYRVGLHNINNAEISRVWLQPKAAPSAGVRYEITADGEFLTQDAAAGLHTGTWADVPMGYDLLPTRYGAERRGADGSFVHAFLTVEVRP